MRRGLIPQVIFILSVTFLIAISCKQDNSYPENGQSAQDKLEKLKLADGFRAEHLYSPSANEQGSWVSMTFDDKGRLITSDQYGALYRMEIAPIGTDSVTKIEVLEIGKTNAELADTTKPRIEMGFAQGLLYAFNSLYVMVNNRPNN